KLARESHTTMRLQGCYLGLRFVFNDYTALDRSDLAVGNALGHYQSLAKDYGTVQVPPLVFLLRLLDEQLWNSRARDAQLVLDSIHANYGTQANSKGLAAKIKEIANRPPLLET